MKFVFMMKSHNFFKKMVDELVDFSEFDPELADGIKWLDVQAQKRESHFMIWCLKYFILMTSIQRQKIG
uniref:Uncharacterized protein n=1 Tax=uncultured marine thaumarchaeote KM3_62_E02 TaxID=1456216 RepID=A0A075HHX6_9ARCH|nr:hypothetical protein [uncultured marine thaumarchaeote KM3_62_E02]